MKNNVKQFLKSSLTISIALIFLSCSKTLTVKELLQNPRNYEKKIVNVEGKVSQSNGIIGIGYFTISDGTNEIYVFTKSGLPIEGENIQVKGRFSQYLKAAFVQVVGIEEAEIIH